MSILGLTAFADTLSLTEFRPGDIEAVFDPLAIVFEAADQNLIYLATINYYDISGAEAAIVRLGSEDFVTQPSDDPAHTFFRGVIQQPLNIRQTVADNVRAAGRGAPCTGTISFVNIDGVLDDVLVPNAVNGREIVVERLDQGKPYAEAQTLFKGIIQAMDFDTDQITLTVSCKNVLLDTPLNDDNRFDGTGGIEGGNDLKDKVKPMALGYTFGVAPLFVGLIDGLPTYMVSGGDALPIQDVKEVFDSGIRLTQVASSPTSGEYSIDTNTGALTLGANPAGTVTCNIEGYVSSVDGEFKSSAADIIETMLIEFAGFGEDEINATDFSTLNSDQNAPIGLWFGASPVSINQAISRVLESVTGYGALDREGVFRVGQLKEPGGAIRAVFDESNTLQFSRVRPQPEALNPPSFRHNVGYQFNHTPITDVASATPEDQRSFMEEAYREASDENLTLQTIHTASEPFFTAGLFRNLTDAAAEAARLLDLFDGDFQVYRIRTRSLILELAVGQNVRVNFPRFGLSDANATILGLNLDVQNSFTDIVVFA